MRLPFLGLAAAAPLTVSSTTKVSSAEAATHTGRFVGTILLPPHAKLSISTTCSSSVDAPITSRPPATYALRHLHETPSGGWHTNQQEQSSTPQLWFQTSELSGSKKSGPSAEMILRARSDFLTVIPIKDTTTHAIPQATSLILTAIPIKDPLIQTQTVDVPRIITEFRTVTINSWYSSSDFSTVATNSLTPTTAIHHSVSTQALRPTSSNEEGLTVTCSSFEPTMIRSVHPSSPESPRVPSYPLESMKQNSAGLPMDNLTIGESTFTALTTTVITSSPDSKSPGAPTTSGGDISDGIQQQVRVSGWGWVLLAGAIGANTAL